MDFILINYFKTIHKVSFCQNYNKGSKTFSEIFSRIPPLAAALDDSKFVDSRWVGAWWLFPLVAVGVSWLLFVIFLGFSSKLPGVLR